MFADALNSIFVRALVALKREEGQTFVEYAMIGVVIAVGLAVVLGYLHDDLNNALDNIRGAI